MGHKFRHIRNTVGSIPTLPTTDNGASHDFPSCHFLSLSFFLSRFAVILNRFMVCSSRGLGYEVFILITSVQIRYTSPFTRANRYSSRSHKPIPVSSTLTSGTIRRIRITVCTSVFQTESTSSTLVSCSNTLLNLLTKVQKLKTLTN